MNLPNANHNVGKHLQLGAAAIDINDDKQERRHFTESSYNANHARVLSPYIQFDDGIKAYLGEVVVDRQSNISIIIDITHEDPKFPMNATFRGMRAMLPSQLPPNLQASASKIARTSVWKTGLTGVLVIETLDQTLMSGLLKNIHY